MTGGLDPDFSSSPRAWGRFDPAGGPPCWVAALSTQRPLLTGKWRQHATILQPRKRAIYSLSAPRWSAGRVRPPRGTGQCPPIAEIRDESPLVTIALHRLLLAILHRCYQGPKNAAVGSRSARRGCSMPTASTPISRSGPERFDLFHEKYPFFQRAGFTTREPSGINRLAQELSRGNNAALFDHTTDEPPPSRHPGPCRPTRNCRAGVRRRRRQERHRQHHARPSRLRGGGARPRRHIV